MSTTDERFMDIALALARRGLGRTTPNPTVGAIVVSPGQSAEVVARGWTQPGGRPHAETVALDAAGHDAKGATLYVTLEPCSHHGRTPPCTDAIIAAGVSRVVCAIGDPDPRVEGRGIKRLTDAGIRVTEGCRRAEANHINKGHFLRVTEQRPFVQLKLAVGSDGLLAPGTGHPVWVTGEAARAQGHLLRARADVILVGSGTVAADDPDLTCRLPGMTDRSPIRVVLDSNALTPPKARLFESLDTAPVWIVCTAAASSERRKALEDRGAHVIVADPNASGGIDLTGLLRQLADAEITRILVEGGPHIARSFWDEGLVDEAVFATGARPTGEGGLCPFVTDGLDLLTKSEHFMQQSDRQVGADRMAVHRRR